MGHADLNVGNGIGSILAQFTIILGLLPLIGRSFRVKKREVFVSGICLLLSLIVVFSTLEKGYVTRLNELRDHINLIYFPYLTSIMRARKYIPNIRDG